MTRMFMALCALTIASGCCTICTPRGVSMAIARVETLVPSCSACGNCSDCVPPRPCEDVYKPWWDYHLTEHTAHRCAYRALHEYRKQCGKPVSHHFKRGFISAYEDIAVNRRPSPPIAPPPLYWNAYYRSCAGRPSVDEWYEGYDAGLGMGLEGGVSDFQEIALRRIGGTKMAPNYTTSNNCDIQQAGQFEPASQDIPYEPPQAPQVTPAYSSSPYNANGRY